MPPPEAARPHADPPGKVDPVIVEQRAPSHGGWQRPVAWGAATLAVGALAFGAVEWQRSNGLYRDFNTVHAPDAADGKCTKFLANRGGGRCASLAADGDAALRWEILGLATGGAAAAVSTLLFLLPGEPARPTAIACAPSLLTPGASCLLRF